MTPEYRGGGWWRGPGKCSDTKSAALAKKVRIETDLPTECQILFGRDGKNECFPGPSGPETLDARKSREDGPDFVRAPADLR